jgi:glycosyltransferase involved in cell wall biosynthesis
MKSKPRLLRITTVPVSLKLLLRGQLSFFREQGFEILAVSADGPEVAAIRQEGIRHQKVPMSRKITPWQDVYCLIRLIIIMRKFRPDIVHTHTPKAGLLGMLAARICGVPVRMHTIAGLPLMETTGLKRQVLKLTEKITYGCAHFVYPNSKRLADYVLSEFQFKNSKIKIIGNGSSNGIDTNYFAASPTLLEESQILRKRYHIEKNSVAFCFIGRIVSDKGVNELIAAFVKVSSEIPAHLFLVGPFEDHLDPISDKSREIINRHPGIIKAGFQEDVRPFLLASDVFVFPSYREGFPNVVLQACCLKVPCIVSDVNGSNEIIDHGITGLIVKRKDTENLYQAMRDLASDSSLRKNFVEKAYRFVVDNFSQKHIWSELLKEYEILLEHSSGRNEN